MILRTEHHARSFAAQAGLASRVLKANPNPTADARRPYHCRCATISHLAKEHHQKKQKRECNAAFFSRIALSFYFYRKFRAIPCPYQVLFNKDSPIDRRYKQMFIPLQGLKFNLFIGSKISPLFNFLFQSFKNRRTEKFA